MIKLYIASRSNYLKLYTKQLADQVFSHFLRPLASNLQDVREPYGDGLSGEKASKSSKTPSAGMTPGNAKLSDVSKRLLNQWMKKSRVRE